MNLFLNDAKLEEAIGENLLGIRIDNNLTCNSHIDYIINKLNSTINLLKLVKKFSFFALQEIIV